MCFSCRTLCFFHQIPQTDFCLILQSPNSKHVLCNLYLNNSHLPTTLECIVLEPLLWSSSLGGTRLFWPQQAHNAAIVPFGVLQSRQSETGASQLYVTGIHTYLLWVYKNHNGLFFLSISPASPVSIISPLRSSAPPSPSLEIDWRRSGKKSFSLQTRGTDLLTGHSGFLHQPDLEPEGFFFNLRHKS